MVWYLKMIGTDGVCAKSQQQQPKAAKGVQTKQVLFHLYNYRPGGLLQNILLMFFLTLIGDVHLLITDCETH